MLVFLTKNFTQGSEAVIKESLLDFVVVETVKPEDYKQWAIDLTKDVIYQKRLDYCFNKRTVAYNKLNQDELRFDDLENNTTTWQDAINAIKAKYPKPV